MGVEPIPLSAFDDGAVARTAGDAIERARRAVGVRRTALFWLDATRGRLTCVATAGVGDRDRWVGQTLAAGLGMAGRAVREGHPVWTPDLLADPQVPIAPWLRDRLQAEGLTVVAAVPISLDGETRGALGFLDGPGRQYDHEGLLQIARLADKVAAELVRGGSSRRCG
jgi:hypothetical protein